MGREWRLTQIRVKAKKHLPILISAVILLATSGGYYATASTCLSVHLGSIEIGVARTLSKRTNRNGNQLDSKCESYSYGYGNWYIPSTGNDKLLAISNWKPIGITGHNREGK